MRNLPQRKVFCYDNGVMENFKGKKVAILGLGVENLPLAHFLVKKGAEVTVCDKDKDLRFKIKDLGTKEWRLGPDYLKHLTDFEIVFRTPGLPLNTPELVEAKQKGVEISSAIKLFFDLCPAKIIGITGTKGKGTCATLIYQILKSKFLNHKSNVYLAGNIGNPAISLLPKLKPSDWVVLELSSFQLQDLNKSPHIAVVLNITIDHLDHHRTKKEYVEAKQNIVRHQSKNDFAIINMDYFTSFEFAALTKGRVFWFSRRKFVEEGCFVRWQDIRAKNKGQRAKRFGRFGEVILRVDGNVHLICPTYEIDLIGSHNLENICAAAVASYLAGARIKDIQKVVTTFKGLEHRLERLGQINGVLYVNDSFSTTPETTIAALESFTSPIILICGGRSKGGNYRQLAKAIVNSSVKSIILIGEMADELEEILNSKSLPASPCEAWQAGLPASGALNTLQADQARNKLQLQIQNLGFASMENIVKTAQKEARPGDIVLFSPGCASFDMFKNATERGEMFKKTVLKI